MAADLPGLACGCSRSTGTTWSPPAWAWSGSSAGSLYALGYVADPAKREPGFMIQSLATAVLLFGALGRIVYVLATVGDA